MPMPSNEARHNLLSNERLDTFWDALWLELLLFLCFIVESSRIACRCLQTKRGAICYRMNRSRASGRPCGSSYGRFDQGAMPGVTQCLCRVFGALPLCYGVRFWGQLFGFIHPPPAPGVLSLLGLDCGIFGLFFITFYSILLGVAILG